MNYRESVFKDLRRRATSHVCDNNELYSIVGPFLQKDMTTSKCRQHISAYEEKHLFYFALFKPQIDNPKESLIENAKRDIRNIRKNGVAPSLRECYAVSEVISRKVVLMYESKEEEFRGIEIEPVIRETDGENDTPLVMFLRFEGECVNFIRCDESIDMFVDCGLNITNKTHSKCLDKRFRNNFDTLRHFLLEKEFLSFSNSSYQDAIPGEMTNMFDLFAQIIYGTQTNEKCVKDLIKAHVEDDDFIQVYMQLVNVEENISENVQKNEKKAEKVMERLSKESFRKRLTDWKSADAVHLFALASVFNAEIYVVSPKDVSGREESNLYLPICGSYLYTFASPLVFRSNKGSPSFEKDFNEECLCCQKTPEIIGQFPIANNTIDLDRIRSLDLLPCCKPKSRHGPHEHYKHILENKLHDRRDNTAWPGGLSDNAKHINDILAEEGRQLELLLGGKGTLTQCISKEVFGDEDTELPISFPENDFERSLQIVADWTGFPIYIFQYCNENCSWEIKNPTTCVKAKNCRYFLTLFLQKNNGRDYVDRIISKTGCNCMLAPPYVAKKVDVSENRDIGKEKRHWPLITFFPNDPPEKMFSDDVRKEMNIIPIHSELRLVMERIDMEDRMIDTMSDYTHSLYRCISKDIFGSEKQYQTIMMEVIAEIKENSNLYGHLLIAEKESADGESLKNFKYRDHKILDRFRFRDTILRESATFFTERIEDGMTLQDLELIAAATCFQVPIYVLSASIQKDRAETEWKLYSQIRRRKQPKDFLRRQQYLTHRDGVYKCLFDAEYVTKFHITIYRTFSGQFHRIASRYRVCNCLMDPPVAFLPQKHKHDYQSDFRLFYHTNCAKTTLTTAKLALDKWIRCNMALEILCSEIIDELEGRRRNVNISTIVGSSVGIAGSALAIAGVIAAPFTAGVSLGLTVGGAVIGSLCGVTVVGATVTEVVLNREANAKFERYYMNFREQSRVLEDSLKKLQALIQVIQKRTLHTEDANGVDTTALQVAAGTLSMISGIPIAVTRVVLRAVSFADIVLPPLTALLDTGFLVYSVYNLVKGSKTNVTERLRSFRSVLRASRTQLSVMAYGNKIKYLQNPT